MTIDKEVVWGCTTLRLDGRLENKVVRKNKDFSFYVPFYEGKSLAVMMVSWRRKFLPYRARVTWFPVDASTMNVGVAVSRPRLPFGDFKRTVDEVDSVCSELGALYLKSEVCPSGKASGLSREVMLRYGWNYAGFDYGTMHTRYWKRLTTK